MFDQPDVKRSACSAVDPTEESLKQLAALPDDGPVVMLNLLQFSAGDGRERYADYARGATPCLQKRGARLLYAGDPAPEFPEAGRGGWDRVLLVYYPSRAAFVDMFADPEYRAVMPLARAGLDRRLLYATKAGVPPTGTPGRVTPLEPVVSNDDEEIFVINLLRFKGPAGLENYAKYGSAVMPEIQSRGGGPRLLLEGELPLVSDGFWHDIVLVHYPKLESLMGMVATPKWQAANEHRQRGLDETIAFPTRPVQVL